MAEERHTIALVDDVPEVRMLVRTQLRLTGYFEIVGEGGTGVEAVALAAAHQPNLLLLDVSMPDMDGLTALPQILAASPGTRVVMLSGFEEQALVQHARELGAVEFLNKQLSVEDLAERLRELALRDGSSTEQAAGPPAAEPAHPADNHARVVLAEHPEDFHEIFEQAAIGMATMTLTARIVRANVAVAGLLGQQAADLVGRHYGQLIAPAAVPELEESIAALTGGDRDVWRFEHELGSDLPGVVLSTIAVVRDSSRRPLYLFLQAQDVTEQKRAREALRQSEERFRLLVEGVGDYAIFMLDPEGRIASWNLGAQRIKGYAAEDVIGEHFRKFYLEEAKAARHPEHELELAARHGRYEEEGWRVRKDGSTFLANVVITALFDNGALVGYSNITRDITERQRAMEEHEKAAAELAESRQLAEVAADKAQFLAVTAHELRSPIAVLAGSAKTLRDHWDRLEEAERADLLEAMVSGGTRMRRLLEDLLTAARLEFGVSEPRLQPTRLDGLLNKVVTERAAIGLDSSDIVVECPSGLMAMADPDWLQQIVTNYVSNAARYGAPPVLVGARRVDDAVELRVSDAGTGVPDDLRPRLFTKFARGRRDMGNGLGLFIVRELARAQGGDAWYEPGQGGGAGFAVRLPAVTH